LKLEAGRERDEGAIGRWGERAKKKEELRSMEF